MSGYSPERDEVFALYVEKELVGKRVKGSKVKITWKFAYRSDLKTHEVELKHSLMSGKREIKFNGGSVFSSKKFFSGPFEYPFSIPRSKGSKNLVVKIEEGREGYAYDLLIDGILFQRNTRISILDFENLRKTMNESARESSVKNIGYSDFVKKSASTLDGKKENVPKDNSKQEEDLLGTDHWTKVNTNAQSEVHDFFGNSNGPTPVPKYQEETENLFNPFDNATPAASSSTPAFDPFSAPAYPDTIDQPLYAQHHQTLDHTYSAPGQMQSSNDHSVNSITAGLDSLDFSNTFASPQQYNTAQPVTQSQQFSTTYNNTSPTTEQHNRTNLLLQPKKEDPLNSLVNLDNITMAPGELFETSTPTIQNTSTAYRFQHGDNKPYARTLIAQPNALSANPPFHSQPNMPIQPVGGIPLQPSAAPLQTSSQYQKNPYQQYQYQQNPFV